MLRNLVLGIVGAIAGASAAIWIGYQFQGNGNSQSQAPSIPITPMVPISPNPSAPGPKQFTTKTARDLKVLYEGRTALQADGLIKPFKGLWIDTSGEIILVNNNPAVLLKNDEDMIECWFGKEWTNILARYSKSEIMRVVRKISETQNSAQIYLTDCEIFGVTVQ